MSDSKAILRQLKIKSGVVNRLFKESDTYRVEAEAQKRKLDKLTADRDEDWDIKNATRMMEESDKMIQDSSQRLGKAVGELKDLIIAAKNDQSLAEAEELLQAEEALETASV